MSRFLGRFVLSAFLAYWASYTPPQAEGRAWARGACESLWVDSHLRSDLSTSAPALDRGLGFLVPNETNNGRLGPKLAQTPQGLYVTTGTERGLMTAALLPENPKGLVLVDRDPKVVFFNLMNRALLSLSKNREDYLALRLRGTFESANVRLQTEGVGISAENNRVLKDPASWRWWKEAVQDSASWQAFYRDPSLNADRAYEGANYLFSDKLFARVSDLAKRDAIYVWQLDMKSDDFKSRLQVTGRQLGVQISLFDLSNAWQEGYIGYQSTIGIFSFLESLMAPTASLIFSYMKKDPQGVRLGESVFDYTVVPRASLRSWDELRSHFVGMDLQDPSRSTYPRTRNPRFNDDF